MAGIGEVRTKVSLFKQLADEHELNVGIEDPAPLPVSPDCPPGVGKMFSLVEGTFFRFRVPEEILSADAWQAIPVSDQRGHRRQLWRSQTKFRDLFEGEPIVMGTVRGDVHFADADAWMHVDESPDEEFAPHEFAPDVPTFFNEFVFGPQYPELVTT